MADEKVFSIDIGVEPNVNTIEWNGAQIQVRSKLKLNEMMRLVGDITNNCFLNDNDYHPEVYEFSVRQCIIGTFTNISMPENIEDTFTLTMQTDLYDHVLSQIDQTQLRVILSAVDEKIQFLKQEHIATMTSRVQELLFGVQELITQITPIFKDIQHEDVVNIIQALNNNKVDEKKLMDAYLDHKKGGDE